MKAPAGCRRRALPASAQPPDRRLEAGSFRRRNIRSLLACGSPLEGPRAAANRSGPGRGNQGRLRPEVTGSLSGLPGSRIYLIHANLPTPLRGLGRGASAPGRPRPAGGWRAYRLRAATAEVPGRGRCRRRLPVLRQRHAPRLRRRRRWARRGLAPAELFGRAAGRIHVAQAGQWDPGSERQDVRRFGTVQRSHRIQQLRVREGGVRHDQVRQQLPGDRGAGAPICGSSGALLGGAGFRVGITPTLMVRREGLYTRNKSKARSGTRPEPCPTSAATWG